MLRSTNKTLSSYLCGSRETIFDRGAAVRLPEEYKKFWREWKETTPEPVHYIPEKGRWYRDKNGEVKRIENVPLPSKHAKELDNVITGGELIIQGFIKKHKRYRRLPRFWMPIVRNSVIYSEVLNKHIAVLMTARAINLIMDHDGFDNYVLKTKACDLGTLLPIRLKRKILLALRDNQLPYDAEMNKTVYEKYKDLMLPPKEIEWYGLTMIEALMKMDEEEEQERLSQIKPLKHIFRQELISELKAKAGAKG